MSVSGRFDFDFVDLVELSSAEFAECLREYVDDPDFSGVVCSCARGCGDVGYIGCSYALFVARKVSSISLPSTLIGSTTNEHTQPIW